MDRGRPMAEAVAELVEAYPADASLIEAWSDRWPEMLGDAHHDTVAVLADLRATGVPLLALTNWSAETFRFAGPRYPFLAWFEAIVVSGSERIVKPDPAIFGLLVDRHGLVPERTVLIDDMPANVEAAARLGFRAIRFTDAVALRRALEDEDLLESTADAERRPPP
jgi:2-haloacid dehalogenase